MLGLIYLTSFAISLVLLGANSFNQVIFGASIGLTLALILFSWVKPSFLSL